ncbi:MAG TPA: hypothetical protein PK036_05725 [Geobacteraceae bacterium]|nr:hypothetical protein [Geobacteraceae bacterium]
MNQPFHSGTLPRLKKKRFSQIQESQYSDKLRIRGFHRFLQLDYRVVYKCLNFTNLLG